MNFNLYKFFLPVLFLIFSCVPKQQFIKYSEITETVLDEWLRRNQDIKTIRAGAWIRIKSPEINSSFNCIYAAKEPRMFRIEVLRPFGSVAVSIASDGKNLSILNYNDNLCFTGELNSKNLEYIVPFHISPELLVTILLTRIPFNDNFQLMSQKIQKDRLIVDYSYIGEFPGRFRFDNEPYFSVSGNAEGIFYRYEEFRKIDKIIIPGMVFMGSDNISLTMRVDKPVLNQMMEPADFILKIPGECPGMEGIIELWQ